MICGRLVPTKCDVKNLPCRGEYDCLETVRHGISRLCIRREHASIRMKAEFHRVWYDIYQRFGAEGMRIPPSQPRHGIVVKVSASDQIIVRCDTVLSVSHDSTMISTLI